MRYGDGTLSGCVEALTANGYYVMTADEHAEFFARAEKAEARLAKLEAAAEAADAYAENDSMANLDRLLDALAALDAQDETTQGGDAS